MMMYYLGKCGQVKKQGCRIDLCVYAPIFDGQGDFFEIHFREFDDSVLHTNELYGDCIFWLHFNCEVSINVCCRFLSRKFSCDGNFNIKP